MDQKTEIRVVSAIADKKQAVLYLEDGSQIILKQGDHRLGDLMDVIIPITTKGEVAVVSLTDFSVYAAFEQKTQGMTKFFRMAKSKISGWFGGKTDTHETHIPEEGKLAILRAVAGETMTEEQVVEHGQPIDPSDEVGADEVVVAVVTTPATEATDQKPAMAEKKTVIPGVQALKPLIDHAVRSNSAQAVQNFLARCAKFIDNRQHSVDDLMRFLEKGDLPLAEDGSIIAYKMLRRRNGQQDLFQDCHSGNIPQRVGSYVCVNESLVDLNRRNECSNGLHIARRGYLGGFDGDVCVLCKIDPEDVMVVPHNDPNKVRVKGYHILGVMSDEAMKALKANKPMTGDEEALTLVYQAIKGNHIDRIERVQVNGQYGRDVVITKLRHDKEKGKGGFDHTRHDLSKAAALDDETNVVGALDPREINKRVNEEHQRLSGTTPTMAVLDGVEDEADADLPDEVEAQIESDIADELAKDFAPDRAEGMEPAEAPAPEPEKPVSELDTLKLDYETAPKGNAKVDAARALVAYKKAKKKGWDKLGFTDGGAAVIRDAQETPAPKPAKEAAPKAGTKEKKAKASSRPKPAPKKTAPKPKPAVASAPKPPRSGAGKTKAEEARDLFNAGKLAELREFKKRVKKGWNVLGFSEAEIEKIVPEQG